MGIFSKVFMKKELRKINEQLKVINEYSPSFTNYKGGIYEMDLTRSAIHSLATHTSKLNPVIKGKAYEKLSKVLQFKPNPYMTTSQFLYKLRTIYEIEGDAFIVPDIVDDEIVAFYPVSSRSSQIKSFNNRLFLTYEFNGKKDSIEYEYVAHLRKYYYRASGELYSASNSALMPTLELISVQNQGIIEGVKNSAAIRFIVRLTTSLMGKDITNERDRFTAENLSMANSTGVIMVGNQYAEVKQIESKQFIVDAGQRKQIEDNVANYFGVSTQIMQNKANEDEWAAFYEGGIEPFAIQLSQALTGMLFSMKELSFGNEVIFEANKTQFMSTKSKVEMISQFLDRGVYNRDEAREVMNMGKIPGGDIYHIRLDYTEIGEDKNGQNNRDNKK
ncbi:phage portal protein [Anaerorhabdus sp.]|uniref:phage portal protein n=1 Tax=Anaerorhabdus sp. TaxID=1872524 RepID=UPI002FC71F47